MKAVVFPNLKKDPALSCAREVCDVLHACNITPIADPELRALFFDKSFDSYQHQATGHQYRQIGLYGSLRTEPNPRNCTA